jgi:hypothetical protein
VFADLDREELPLDLLTGEGAVEAELVEDERDVG